MTQIAYSGLFWTQFRVSRDIFTDLTAGKATVRTFLPRLLTAASRIQNCTYRKIITYQNPQSNLPISLTLKHTEDLKNWPTFCKQCFFKWICWNETLLWLLSKYHWKFVPKNPTDYKLVLVRVMAWHRTGDNPISKPMLTKLHGVTSPHLSFRLSSDCNVNLIGSEGCLQ